MTTAPNRVELTLRGVVLGILITLIFTAANVYLGLKVGLTFATSIPAAIISMALLKAFKSSTIYENNIVQTVASAAGAMASVIFVLPGLVMIGWWTGFPFWMTFGVCAAGGVLGVMYTIPLRRALVTTSDLPYPEGVAAAEVLKVGAGADSGDAQAAAEGKSGLMAIVIGSVVSAAVAVGVAARLFAAEVAGYFRFGAGSATGLGGSMSLALLGAGHLVGISVGLAMAVGIFIAWGVAVPVLTHLAPQDLAVSAADFAGKIWSTKVRFIGAGAIGVAALWSLARLVAPIISGLAAAMAAQRERREGHGEALPLAEQDLSIGLVAGISLVCLVPLAVLLTLFLQGGVLAPLTLPLVSVAILYIAIAGFGVAAVCGYMAGLIGSSQSPVSGVAILAVLGAALMAAAMAGSAVTGDAKPLIAFVLLVTAALLAAAVSANDNLQDLKTGQLVEATPWRQQVALVIGVVAGSVMIPPILNLLNKANGFAGGPAGISSDPLPAPQATLISSIAKGVIEGGLDWGLIGIGCVLGAVLVMIDSGLRARSRYSLPPLAVGIAIYLPSSVTTPLVIGAVAGWFYDRHVAKKPYGVVAKRLGVLMVSGLIVGESLFNVALAGLIAATGKGSPIAVFPEDFKLALPLAALGFVASGIGLYRWTAARARKDGAKA